jgi:DNA-binding response OmpR family regulator
MHTFPEVTPNRLVPVLSISPAAEDHCAIQNILRHLQSTLDPSRTFAVHSCATLAAVLAAFAKRQFEVIVCERDLQPGSWKDVLEQAVILPDPPVLIVTSRLADDRLWAEALNLGAFDVLAKPFDRTETMRAVDAAWRSFGSRRRFAARRERLQPLKVAAAGSAL